MSSNKDYKLINQFVSSAIAVAVSSAAFSMEKSDHDWQSISSIHSSLFNEVKTELESKSEIEKIINNNQAALDGTILNTEYFTETLRLGEIPTTKYQAYKDIIIDCIASPLSVKKYMESMLAPRILSIKFSLSPGRDYGSNVLVVKNTETTLKYDGGLTVIQPQEIAGFLALQDVFSNFSIRQTSRFNPVTADYLQNDSDFIPNLKTYQYVIGDNFFISCNSIEKLKAKVLSLVDVKSVASLAKD